LLAAFGSPYQSRKDGSGLLIERFELLAWAESAERLIDKLA
jgi:hypothetical protein